VFGIFIRNGTINRTRGAIIKKVLFLKFNMYVGGAYEIDECHFSFGSISTCPL